MQQAPWTLRFADINGRSYAVGVKERVASDYDAEFIVWLEGEELGALVRRGDTGRFENPEFGSEAYQYATLEEGVRDLLLDYDALEG